MFKGCSGFWVEDAGADVLIKCYPKNVEAFLQLLLKSKLPIKQTRVLKEVVQDYAALTKKFFQPIRASGVKILAPWHRTRDPGPHIVIEAGMAFGTGRHESTKLMLRMMNAVEFRKKSVLDLGSGSGILAIYAALRGARSVTAVDSDPLAMEAARHNFDLNKVKRIRLACTDLAHVSGTFHIVLANLDFDTFRKYCQNIARRVVEGGYLLVSGIEAQYAKGLPSLFADHTLVKTMKMNDWYGFTFRIDKRRSLG